jgi:uncharacterized protein YndB with AHSA1/START domain
MEKVFEIYIKTSPEALWNAITDPAVRPRFSFGNTFTGGLASQGAHFEVTNPKAPGMVLAEGEYLEVVPYKRLAQTMLARWDEDVIAEGVSRVTWEIEQVEDSCRLTVTHNQLRDGANEQLYGGWPMILSGLKTWLETGTELTTPGSLMYGS